MLPNSIISIYYRCHATVADNKPCTQCETLKKVLARRISRLKTNKSPHIAKFKLMTVNQMYNRLLTVKRENAALRRQLIRLSRRLKVVIQ